MTLSPIEILTGEITGLGSDITPQTLETWQMARIREAAERAEAESSFYAGKLTGIDLSKIRSADDLAALPFTCPSDIAASPDDFICVPARDIARVRTIKTSGTTCSPKRIFFTENDTKRTIRFFNRGMTTFTNHGDSVMIAMSDNSTDSIASLLKSGVEMMGANAKIHGAITDIDRAREDAKNADVIAALPKEIRYLCASCPELRPKAVLLSADYIPRGIIESLKQTWHCEVYTHYGLTETCYGCAVQCRALEAQHIRHEEDYIEIIDPDTGLPLPRGARGEVVITNFASEAMPLIRYRTGDISSLADSPCGCGGVLPRLGRVYGRRGTNSKIPDAASLEEIVYALPQIRIFSAELKDALLDVAVDSVLPFDADALAGEIRAVFPWLSVLVSRCEIAPSCASGKFSVEISASK